MTAFQSRSADTSAAGATPAPIIAERPGHWVIQDRNAALALDGLNAHSARFPGLNGSTVPWQDIRSVIAKGARALHLDGGAERLYDACRTRFDALTAAEPFDLTSAVMAVMANSALPLILDDDAAIRRLAADQNDKIRRQLDMRNGRSRRRDGFVSLYREFSAGRAVSRALRRRRVDETARADLSAHLLELRGAIGVKGLSYLILSLSSAASTAPGAIAASLLFRLLEDEGRAAMLAAELGHWNPGTTAQQAKRGLPATTQFIREAMRLYPFPPATRRLAHVDLPFENITIAKGDTYDLNADHFHRSPAIWPDPEAFDDSRWADPSPAQLQHFFPFGFGNRTCPGATIGMDQLLVFLRLATVEYCFALVDGPAPEMSNLILHAPTGMVGTVRRR